MGVLGDLELYQSKTHPDLSIPLNTQLVLLYLPPFGRNSNVKLYHPPPNATARLGGGGAIGSNMVIVPIEMSSKYPIRLVYTLYAYLAPFGHNTQRVRQMTDRAIRIGRLYHSISDLINFQSKTLLYKGLDPFSIPRCAHSRYEYAQISRTPIESHASYLSVGKFVRRYWLPLRSPMLQHQHMRPIAVVDKRIKIWPIVQKSNMNYI